MVQLGFCEYVERHSFDAAAFLANAGPGRRIVRFGPKSSLFSQGDPADSVFYLQEGRAKLTVVSQNGKEATIRFLSAGDFAGEGALAAAAGLRMTTATAVSNCTALKITREEMIREMHDEPALADFFLKFLLARSMRTQADLVDQLFNSRRKATGEDSLADGRIWTTGDAGHLYSSRHTRNFGGDGRHHAIPHQLFHESLSQAWIYQL